MHILSIRNILRSYENTCSHSVFLYIINYLKNKKKCQLQPKMYISTYQMSLVSHLLKFMRRIRSGRIYPLDVLHCSLKLYFNGLVLLNSSHPRSF